MPNARFKSLLKPPNTREARRKPQKSAYLPRLRLAVLPARQCRHGKMEGLQPITDRHAQHGCHKSTSTSHTQHGHAKRAQTRKTTLRKCPVGGGSGSAAAVGGRGKCWSRFSLPLNHNNRRRAGVGEAAAEWARGPAADRRAGDVGGGVEAAGSGLRGCRAPDLLGSRSPAPFRPRAPGKAGIWFVGLGLVGLGCGVCLPCPELAKDFSLQNPLWVLVSSEWGRGGGLASAIYGTPSHPGHHEFYDFNVVSV